MRASGAHQSWLSAADCRLPDFQAIVEQDLDLGDYPYADAAIEEVLCYGERAASAGRRDLQGELAQALLEGPGVVVFRRAFAADVLDRVSAVFASLIEKQKAHGVQTGDHFAKPGANDRLWGALEKLALADPEAFVDYYANDILALVFAAWLGPNYRVISEPNVVNPGNAAQRLHRDFHLGIMGIELAEQFPAHIHRASPTLTLQAAVAHVDMPVETGPTMYVPHSHKYEHGYLAAELPQFQDYINSRYVQLPLEKGDVVFFNPAVLHGAGANRTSDVRRMVNLLQIASAFGRSSATVDTRVLSMAVYPTLSARRRAGVSERYLRNVIATAADGYPFPTNLDRDLPIESLTPESQAQLLWRALEEDWNDEALKSALDAQAERRLSSFA
jgi:ectoine hydroxylase-related dioxygenase (phytanoyl-CoA dioxygenase family)